MGHWKDAREVCSVATEGGITAFMNRYHMEPMNTGNSNPPTVITAVRAGCKSLLEPVKCSATEIGQQIITWSIAFLHSSQSYFCLSSSTWFLPPSYMLLRDVIWLSLHRFYLQLQNTEDNNNCLFRLHAIPKNPNISVGKTAFNHLHKQVATLYHVPRLIVHGSREQSINPWYRGLNFNIVLKDAEQKMICK